MPFLIVRVSVSVSRKQELELKTLLEQGTGFSFQNGTGGRVFVQPQRDPVVVTDPTGIARMPHLKATHLPREIEGSKYTRYTNGARHACPLGESKGNSCGKAEAAVQEAPSERRTARPRQQVSR